MKNIVIAVLFVLNCVAAAFAQNVEAVQAPVPSFINYSGVLQNASHNSVVGVTFLLYRDQQGGAPLWMETQNIRLDASGHYNVRLGAVSAHGMPFDLFQSGEARWLAVQPVGESEQPRVLLVAVPYAMKAADAATIGGLPPSAFVLAAPPVNAGASTGAASASTTDSSALLPPSTSNVTTTGGTVSTLPLFTTGTNIQNSALSQTGTGTSTKLYVKGALAFQATGGATASSGKASYPINLTASVFNGSTHTGVGQTFQLKSEPVNNNTANASATLSVLFGEGTATPADTGFKISSNGRITFAAGQTFPGALDLNGTAAGFIGLGRNTSGGGNALTVSGGSAATGATDAQGGDLILAAGDGTGAGGSGGIHLQAASSAASGTVANTFVDRYYIAPNPVSMGNQSGFGRGPIALLTLPPNSGGGFMLRYAIVANDGATNYAGESGNCVLSAVSNSTGWQAVGVANVDTMSSFGSPNSECSLYIGSGFQVGAEVADNLSFVPTTHFVYYQIENLSGDPLTLSAPSSKDAVNSGFHTDATHPSVSIRNDGHGLPVAK